jgi:hypothetical protein
MIQHKFGKVAALTVAAGLISGFVSAPVHAASNTIVVWADETRGPNQAVTGFLVTPSKSFPFQALML